jgi:hypothetical protein
VNVCATTALPALWLQHSEKKTGFITCYLYGVIEKFIIIFVLSITSKLKPFSAFRAQQ